MVLVADNPPYNYESEISSLSAIKENNSIDHDKTLEKIGTWIVMCKQLLICFVNYLLIVKNVATCLKIAITIFFSIYEEIGGQIGLVVVDNTFRYGSVMLPIKNLVADLTKDVK